jgi:hypothetical protein
MHFRTPFGKKWPKKQAGGKPSQHDIVKQERIGITQ